MRHSHPRRPSPALVISLLALFVSLGGAAYAATNLPKNSVGSKQIKKSAVNAAKLKKNSVNSSKVKNHSLKAADFKNGQLPAGPKGATGATGPAGAAGATNVVMRTGPTFSIARNDFAMGEATCEPGERATGGGVLTQNVYFPSLVSSFPTPNPHEESPATA